MTIVENPTITVTGGVDTHLEFHVVASSTLVPGSIRHEGFMTPDRGFRVR